MAQVINTISPRADYTASASQTTFSVGFPFFLDTDIEVYQNTAGEDPGPSDLLTLTTHYTVTGAGSDSGGTVTLVTPASVNDRVVIRSKIPNDRQTNFQILGDFTAAAINAQLNDLTQMVKQIEVLKADRYTEDTPEIFAPLAIQSAVNSNEAVTKAQLEAHAFTAVTSDTPVVASITELKAVLTASFTEVFVTGYASANDGGGGHYTYNSGSVVADNGGTVIAPDVGAGRWELLATEVRVAQFGALGSGEETSELQAALNWVGESGGTLKFRDGVTYTINAQLTLASKSGFRLLGHATIKMDDSVSVGTGFSCIFLDTCTDFEMYSLTFDANRANRTPAEVPAHTVFLRECKRFTLGQVQSVNGVVDGFYLDTSDNTTASTFNQLGTFLQCRADNCYRNGMSIINGYDINVIGGEYINTTGTAPQAGIDIESDASAANPGNSRIHITGVRLDGNAGFGLQYSGVENPEDVVFMANHFEDNALGGINVGGPCSIIGNTFNNFTAATRGIIDVNATVASKGVVSGNILTDCTGGTACIYVHSTSVGGWTVSDNNLTNVVIGIQADADGTKVSGNKIKTAAGIGITSAADDSQIVQNRIEAATARGVSATGARTKVVLNEVVDTASVVADIDMDGTDQTADYNTCRASTPQATQIGISFLNAPGSCMHNECVNLHTTDPYTFTAGEYSGPIGFNEGGTANDKRTMRSGVGHPVYTNATRPAATNYAAGTAIWNTDDNFINVSDGTSWYDPTGAVT